MCHPNLPRVLRSRYLPAVPKDWGAQAAHAEPIHHPQGLQVPLRRCPRVPPLH